MRYGIHLPHAGEQATPALIRRYAERADALGLDDIWVSEHIIVPRKIFPRSPLFYDAVLTLTWVAAVTRRVRLGTSVLVLPMRHPLPLAKELSTLHNLSDGRLILGVGRRMDEGIDMMRAVWSQDPVTFRGKYIGAEVADMTMLPHPVTPIPLWFGAHSDAALKRTTRIGDGWHGSRYSPAEAEPLIRRLRAERPEPGFTISMRVQWNGQDEGELRDLVAAYEAVGVGHLLIAPVDRDVDDWDKVIAGVGRLVGR
jgi:alkanesulfonate monooxygenase SsuD/methylene tetrahydromethanopterin reductase-like flavin-dependent oxidoreductase (luciferase family)